MERADGVAGSGRYVPEPDASHSDVRRCIPLPVSMPGGDGRSGLKCLRKGIMKADAFA